MTFIDTGGWFAFFVSSDSRHQIADAWFKKNRTRLVTTDYVVAELFTLMRARGESQKAVEIGPSLIEGVACRLVRVELEDFQKAWEVFSQFLDKNWSFTDCVSRVVMERLKITTAFAFDEHFRQFGTVVVVP